MNKRIIRLVCLFLGFGILILATNGCNKSEEAANKPPTCTITNPANGNQFQQTLLVTITVDANDADGEITAVVFYIDGLVVGSKSSLPYSFDWNTDVVNTGSHAIKATAKDNDGSSGSDEIAIIVIEADSSLKVPVASFTSNLTFISPGSSVQFTDLSAKTPTTWLWNFGDGNISTSQNPSHTFPIEGLFTVSLAVSNSFGTDTAIKINYITVSAGGTETGTVADYDGNLYNTVKIGDQWWMAEDIKTTHFADGEAIPVVEDNTAWINLGYTDKARCFYDNSLQNGNTYGALYSWAAAMNGAGTSEINPSGVRGVCPDGWHLPSDAEWIELEMFLGMSFAQADAFGWRGTDEGSKMKATYGWLNNGNGTNTSGFSALPGGTRLNGPFDGLGGTARYWSTTEYINITHYAFTRTLDYQHSGVGWFFANHYYGFPKDFGLSVRCVKD